MHSIDSQRQWSANFHPSGILKLVSANHKLSLEGAQEILEAKNTVATTKHIYVLTSNRWKTP